MFFKKVAHTALAISLGCILSACGSDSDNTLHSDPVDPPAPTQPPANDDNITGSAKFDNVWGPNVKYSLETPFTVFFKKPARADISNFYASNPPLDPDVLFIDPKDIIAAHPKPLRDDLLQDGVLTIADILVYLSDTRDDFHMDYVWGDDIGEYRYTVYYDDGNSVYNDDGTPKEALANPNYYVNSFYPQGELLKDDAIYDSNGEATYRRLSTEVVSDGFGFWIREFSPLMTEKREMSQRMEVQKREETKEMCKHENCTIIPTVIVGNMNIDGGWNYKDNFENGTEPSVSKEVFMNVEARPFNLRPDIFKKDTTVTLADVFLSMHEDGLIDIEYSFWGTNASGVKVDHFTVSKVNGFQQRGAFAYTQVAVDQSFSAFGPKYGLFHPMVYDEVEPSYCDGFDDFGKPTGLADGAPDPGCENVDITDWFGHVKVHHFPDVWVLENPPLVANLSPFSMYNYFVPAEGKRWADDGQYPVYDIKDAVAPLDESHFGWGIADCGTCHSLDNIHSGGDSGTLGYNPTPVYVADLFKDGTQAYSEDHPTHGKDRVIAPYQCAQCHGANGAPKGHGEIARCFYCHTNSFEPKNHGQAIKDFVKMYEGGNSKELMQLSYADDIIEVDSTDEAAVAQLSLDMKGDQNYLSDRFKQGHDNNPYVMFHGKYADNLKVKSNSDYTTDPLYPDPYACVTCHTND